MGEVYQETLRDLGRIWPASMIGTMVIGLFIPVGWKLGGDRNRSIVTAVSWWLTRIVRPLARQKTIRRRSIAIAANNLIVCGLVILAGSAGRIGWLAVATVGLSLGIALRLMQPAGPDERAEEETGVQTEPHHRPLMVIGLALNLVEIPAIMLTAGIALSQGAWTSSLDLGEAMAVFFTLVVPMLVVAAAGEGLWLGYDKTRW